MKNLYTHFQVSSPAVKTLQFGEKAKCAFNYVDLPKELKSIACLDKQMNSSYVLSITVDDTELGEIPELKITNQSISSWEDLWINEANNSVDPGIQHINLQKNDLIHANFNLRREKLKVLNLEGNEYMGAVIIRDAPALEVLNVSNCPYLDIVHLGKCTAIKTLLARNCNFTPQAMESLLSGFTPTKTASLNQDSLLLKKSYDTVLDLRGSVIDWSNRKIASKIRLLLCNNWLVLWDNMPPSSVVPPQMYSFFTNNISDSLIKAHYN